MFIRETLIKYMALRWPHFWQNYGPRYNNDAYLDSPGFGLSYDMQITFESIF